MNPVSGDCPHTAAVALVGFEENEIAYLEGIFEQAENYLPANCVWELHRTPTVDAVVRSLASEPVSIVMHDSDRAPLQWRYLLERLGTLPRPPLQIVTSRIVTDQLWAEALNLGAYDVLARPFEPAEVLRTLSMAWRRWHDSRPVADTDEPLRHNGVHESCSAARAGASDQPPAADGRGCAA